MKYLLITDNHFCETSSVQTKRGRVFSSRLENQKSSLMWAALFGLPVIHLGDFFNRDVLNAEEISCLKEIKETIDFSNWIFLQGNHGYSGGFDVMGVFEQNVISVPTKMNLGGRKCLFLPFKSTTDDIDDDYDIIFGHIGIEGVPFGAKGFLPKDIQEHCKLFLNGHLHNKLNFAEGCWNIGSLTAQNFSDECQGAEKGAWILDTDTLEITFYENPYAFNFYKMTAKEALEYPVRLSTSCISVTCDESNVDEIRQRLKGAYYLRLNVQRKKTKVERVETRSSVDYLEKFRQSYIKKNGESAVILDELQEVTNG